MLSEKVTLVPIQAGRTEHTIQPACRKQFPIVPKAPCVIIIGRQWRPRLHADVAFIKVVHSIYLSESSAVRGILLKIPQIGLLRKMCA